MCGSPSHEIMCGSPSTFPYMGIVVCPTLLPQAIFGALNNTHIRSHDIMLIFYHIMHDVYSIIHSKEGKIQSLYYRSGVMSQHEWPRAMPSSVCLITTTRRQSKAHRSDSWARILQQELVLPTSQALCRVGTMKCSILTLTRTPAIEMKCVATIPR